MSSVQKIEHDYIAADLANVERLLVSLTEQDVVVRAGLEARRDDLQRELGELERDEHHLASAALFFGGAPVVGSLGIESEFGGTALAKFQDLVTKLFANAEHGELGKRGVVANKASTRLHITSVIRGSFGFLLEEVSEQGALFDTSLKAAVDSASRLLAAFAEDDEENFRAEVETVDQRVLNTAREFFGLMSTDQATFRLVVGTSDKSFDTNVVARAAARAIATAISDDEEFLLGALTGVLPEGHLFEFRAEGERGVVRGKVDPALSAQELADFNRRWIETPSRAAVRVRRVLNDGEVVREAFTLLRLHQRG